MELAVSGRAVGHGPFGSYQWREERGGDSNGATRMCFFNCSQRARRDTQAGKLIRCGYHFQAGIVVEERKVGGKGVVIGWDSQGDYVARFGWCRGAFSLDGGRRSKRFAMAAGHHRIRWGPLRSDGTVTALGEIIFTAFIAVRRPTRVRETQPAVGGGGAVGDQGHTGLGLRAGDCKLDGRLGRFQQDPNY